MAFGFFSHDFDDQQHPDVALCREREGAGAMSDGIWKVALSDVGMFSNRISCKPFLAKAGGRGETRGARSRRKSRRKTYGKARKLSIQMR